MTATPNTYIYNFHLHSRGLLSGKLVLHVSSAISVLLKAACDGDHSICSLTIIPVLLSTSFCLKLSNCFVEK